MVREAAEEGVAGAECDLGFLYTTGASGVQQDHEEAVKCYRMAAAQNYANAQFNLGNCYANGRGVQQDYEEAVKCYRMAAAQNHAGAKAALAKMSDLG